jgi:hypothetical protein
MTLQEKQNLEFYDRFGYNLNLEFDTDRGHWYGNLFFPKISINLFEVLHVFIFDRVTFNGSTHLATYQSDAINQYPTEFWAHWKDDEYVGTPEIFLFNIDQFDNVTATNVVSQSADNVNFYTSFVLNRKVVDDFSSVGNRIDVALKSDHEGIFKKTLIITQYNLTTELYDTVAEIECYGETEGEDVRLNDLLTNIGSQIPQQDFQIFKNSDPEEPLPDWMLMNPKRKEFVLTQQEIKNYEMSYRGLINAIRFYGFDLGIKEYWQNIDPNSESYGSFKLIDVLNSLNDDIKQIQELNMISVPSRIYKKTSFLKLIYNINKIIPDEFDVDSLPVTEETSDFSVKEILQKLFLLKKKLTNFYLPTKVKIIDITGEAVYFAKLKQTTYSIQHNISQFYTTPTPKIKVLPSNVGRVEDLRISLFDVDSTLSLTGIDYTIDDITLGGTMLDLEDGAEFDYNNVRNMIVNSGINEYLNDNFQKFKEVFLSYFINNESLDLYSDNENSACGYLCELVADYPDYTLNQMGMCFDDFDDYFTFDNLGFGHVYEIEWTVTKQLSPDSLQPFTYSKTGLITDLYTLKIILPFIGKYDVHVRVFDLLGNVIDSFNNGLITVISNNVEFLGVYKEPYRNMTIANSASLTLDDMTGSFDRPYASKLTFDDAKITFDALNHGNYALSPPFKEIDNYTFDNLMFATFDDVEHLTFDNVEFAMISDWVDIDDMSIYTINALSSLTFNDFTLQKIKSDLPTSFPIYLLNNVDDTATFPILTVSDIGNNFRIVNSNGVFEFGYGLVDISDLNQVDAFLVAIRLAFPDYEFNPLFEYDASPIPIAIGLDRIIVTAKLVTQVFDCSVEYWTSLVDDGVNPPIEYNNNELIGSLRGRSFEVNYDISETNLFSSRTTFNNYTQILFSSDNCSIPGKNAHEWTLTHLDTSSVVQLNERYFTHLFTQTGDYNLKLVVRDSNGNTSENEFIGFINITR